MLINEILDLSRVEAGRYELKEESVSLAGVVEECRHLLCDARQERATSAVIEQLDTNLPRLWADERAVRQVTLNLLSNAIKFTPAGRHASRSRSAGRSTGGQYLSIRDTGPGIAEEEIPIVLVLVRARLAGAEERRRRLGPRPADRQGPRRTARRRVPLKSKVREGTEVIVIFPPERVMNALPQLDPNAPPEPTAEEVAARRARRWGRRAAA